MKRARRRGNAGRVNHRLDIWIGLALMLMALVLRLHAVNRVLDWTLYGDMVHYDASATLLLTKHYFSFWGGAPDAYVTPGYPLFLALCYAIAKLHSPSHQSALHFAAMVQAFLLSTTSGFLYWTCRYGLRRLWALSAALLWTLYLPSIWAPRNILTESLYVFLLLLFVWLFTMAMHHGTWPLWAAAGFVLGLDGLVRPTVFPLVLAAAIFFFTQLRQGGSWRASILCYAAHLIGFLIPLVPWWIRNHRLFHQWILSDTEIGNPLLYGTDPNFRNDPMLGHGLTQIEQKQLAIHRIITGFSHHPLFYLWWYTIGKLENLFGKPWYQPITAHTSHVTVTWLHLNLLWVILGAVGLIIGLFTPYMRFIAWLAIFLIVVQLPFIPINRYAFPVMPLFFAGVGLLAQSAMQGIIRSIQRGGAAA
ncbi:MAG: glycosyltransferase family 39 protein [Alicyclobacillus sp.]|nr:glycosyltransferase family 39 protein [Alicyclobacillus sp.]